MSKQKWYQYDFKTLDGKVVKQSIQVGKMKKFIQKSYCQKLSTEYGKDIKVIERIYE